MHADPTAGGHDPAGRPLRREAVAAERPDTGSGRGTEEEEEEHAPRVVGPGEFDAGCDAEPIHLAGGVQPEGALLAIEGLADGPGRVVCVSENIGRVLEVGPGELLGREGRSLFDSPGWLAEAAAVPAIADGNPYRLVPAGGGGFDASLHHAGGDLVIEFDLRERSGGSGAGGAHDAFGFLGGPSRAVRTAKTVAEIGRIVTESVRRFTGFDRVMLYKFEPDGHGVVVGEDRAEAMESYLDLRFPASDVPRNSRALYARNPVRVIGDSAADPVGLLAVRDRAEAYDLSASVWRAVAPVHREYLGNMGVRGSMSISVMRGEELWGLIACHHRTPRAAPAALRSACAMFGGVVAAQIAAVETRIEADEFAARRERLTGLVTKMATVADPVRAVATSVRPGRAAARDGVPNLLEVEGLAAVVSGRVRTFGHAPPPELVASLRDRLRERGVPPVFATDRIAEEIFSGAGDDGAWAGEGLPCGVLALEYETGDALFFFRPEVTQTVDWAGDPYKRSGPRRNGDARGQTADRDEGPGSHGDFAAGERLRPRASFAIWTEKVRGRSAPWSEADRTLATELWTAFGDYLLRRADEIARLNRELAARNDEIAQLLYTVAHDLKSPLVTCRGFAGLLREDLLEGRDEHVLDSVDRIEKSAGFMARLIDDLLGYSRLGREEHAPTTVTGARLASRVRDAHDFPFAEAGGRLVVVEPLPDVVADETKLGRVFDNLLSNALKYGLTSGEGAVEVSGTHDRESGEVVYAITDHGPGVPERLRERVFDLFQRGRSDGEGTGVGLASVRKIMDRHDGRVWIETTPGGGATFKIGFPPTAPVAVIADLSA